MKINQVSSGVFDLEAETPAEQDFVCTTCLMVVVFRVNL